MSDDDQPRSRAALVIVGVGADGLTGLPERVRRIVTDAAVVLGGTRHLQMLPPSPRQRREAWPSPLRPHLPALLDSLPDGRVVALASGDPLLSGIGTTLIEILGTDGVEIHPTVSSSTLARAELGWSAESCETVSLVGRDPALVLRELAPGHRVVVLSSDETTPQRVADLLTGAGYGSSLLHVLGDLGSPAATRRDGRADGWSGPSPRLNVIGLELTGPQLAGWVAGVADSAFEHDGQLTKRDLRASALARLAPAPGQHLWDVGAGAGSVGIEWMRAHRTCHTCAVEADAGRAERIAGNARRLGVPGLRVIHGRAPEALTGLPSPDAIFVGGGATGPGVLDLCLAALPAGGRLVVHGVTVETERLLGERHHQHGGELSRIAVEIAGPIGSYTGWTPARTVTQWAFTQP